MMFYMPVMYTSPGEYQVVDNLPLKSSTRRKIRTIVKVFKLDFYIGPIVALSGTSFWEAISPGSLGDGIPPVGSSGKAPVGGLGD